MKMTVASILSMILAMAFSPSVLAKKDSNFYYPGFVNPNVNQEMYWKDSLNVLQDLDQFSALYIKQHGCVYSLYEYSSDDEDQQDEDGMTICGGYGGEDYWYLGKTPCFKANSAFSLYGILKSSSQGSDSTGSFCHQHTYIDTYFTTLGVETLGNAFDLIADDGDGNIPSSKCEEVAPEGAEDNYEDDGENYYTFEGYESYGTGCSSGKYVYDKFDGAFCKGTNISETIDTFDTFNEAMSDLECAQIYAVDDEGRKLEEDGDKLNILTYSRSCSIRLYPNQCPDPYGLKIKYVQALENALETKSSYVARSGSREEKAMKAFSWIFLVGGIVLMLSTCCMHRRVAARTTKDAPEDTMLPEDISKPLSFVHQVSSTVSRAVISVQEPIRSFCEADEPVSVKEPAPVEKPASLEPYVPLWKVEAQAMPIETGEEEQAMPIETGEASLPEVPPSRKKRRPRLNNLSKRLFASKDKKDQI